MTGREGTIYKTNRKNLWVIVTSGEKTAQIVVAATRDEAAKKFFSSRNMRMVKVKS